MDLTGLPHVGRVKAVTDETSTACSSWDVTMVVLNLFHTLAANPVHWPPRQQQQLTGRQDV
ncbi:hypothetical protein O9K51_07326 [Purpureocillium lavendulum]|uniref:Uncharacterized protein n=1 Tax=Purpureocillium lavendulum TaxID=1247861 RepID=A0AB34FKR1_9HYPO|nr:hypothetical protein O9K51_07326 [Purpureocillium lavendulum]